MTDSTFLTKQRMFKTKILPQLKNFTQAALATLMTFSMSALELTLTYKGIIKEAEKFTLDMNYLGQPRCGKN